MPADELQPIRSASVLMPTYQGMEFLERLLDALAVQEAPFPWDVHVVDSSSSDGTWELLQARARDFPVPFHARRIRGDEFDHGDTRNALAAESEGELLVFLTQDAIPSHPDWLAALARNFEDPDVGAAYCRNVHREDSWLLTRVFTRADPSYADERRETRIEDRAAYDALSDHERRLYCNFNDVASAIRRSLWERYPFPRTMMGEDVLIGRAILEAGYTIVYDADATIDHSHDYGPEKSRWRGKVDAAFNVEWLDRVSIRDEQDVEAHVERVVAEDVEHLRSLGFAGEELDVLEARARELRAASALGLLEGGRSPLRYPRSVMRPRRELHVLYVVPGFAPEDRGELATHVLEVGHALHTRGHHVSVLTAATPVGNEPDFTVREDRYGPLRLLRMTNRHAHADVRQSFSDPRVDEVFAGVLRSVAPDLVHVEGLRHHSAGIVDVARRAGVPTVVSLRDAWAHCPRVSFLRPDGELCAHGMGAGCLACIKNRSKWIEPLAALERRAEEGGLAGPAARVILRRAGAARDGSKLAQLRERPTVLGEAAARADLRLAPTRALRELHVDPERYDPHQLVATADGVRDDLLRRAKRPEPTGLLRVGFFGALVPETGVLDLIDAAASLAERGVRLRIFAGFDPRSHPFHTEVARRAPEGVVEFAGFPDRAALTDLHAELDAVVVPSRGRGVGLAALNEARRAGTPVVVADLPDLVEHVRDGEDGLVFPRGDVRGLSECLARLADDRALGPRLAAAAPPAKSLSEQARELEFRYGALCCVTRSTIPLLHRAVEDGDLEGPAERVGGGWLLLRPGSRARFRAGRLPHGPVTVDLEQLVVGGESEVHLGGRLLVDGQPVAHFPTLEPGAEDVERSSTVLAEIPRGARELTLEPFEGEHGIAHCLRVRRLRIRERPPERKEPSVERSGRAARGSPDLLDVARRLRVEPGPPVLRDRLPRVLVVIPSYDGREVLADCLASAAELDYPGDRLRIVVVDNGSTDGTGEMVAGRFPSVQVLRREKNLGFAAACNAGAELAAGSELLAFLNNDMRFSPDFLHELVGPIAREECDATSAKVLSWDGATIDGGGTGSNFLGIAVQPGFGAPPGPEHEIQRETLFPCGGNMAIRTEVFERSGGFDAEYFAYYEDLDLGWRLWLMGHSVRYVPTAVCYHRHSHTSGRMPQRAVRLAMVRNSLLTCVKNYADETLNAVLPALLALAVRRAALHARTSDEGFRIETAELDGEGATDGSAMVEVGELGAADLLGIDDLLRDWDRWMERRVAVQALRTRPDAEILRLFLDPFACVEGDRAYRALQEALIERFGLERIFAEAPAPTPAPRTAAPR